jgi:hypothetical protein
LLEAALSRASLKIPGGGALSADEDAVELVGAATAAATVVVVVEVVAESGDMVSQKKEKATRHKQHVYMFDGRVGSSLA